MADFKSQITIQAIDKVTPVTKTINKSLDGLRRTNLALSSTLSSVTSGAAVFASKLKLFSLGALGAGAAIVALSKKTSDAAESILNLSQRTGVSVEALQKYNYIADQAGVSTDLFATSFKFLNRSIADASAGIEGDASNAFATLGISLKDANGQLKNTDAILLEISDAFSKAEDGPLKVRTATALLGKTGEQLIPVLNKGAAALKKQGDEFARFGNLMSKEQLEAIQQFGDELDKVKLTFIAIGSIIAQAVIPYLQPLAQRFANFVSSNKELIRTKVTEFLQNFARAVQAVWPKIVQIGQAIGAAVEKFGGLETVLVNLIGLKIVDLAASFGRVSAAIALAALAVYDLSKAFPEMAAEFKAAIDKMFGWLNNFKLALDSVKNTVRNITDKVGITTSAAPAAPTGPAAITPIGGKTILNPTAEQVANAQSSPGAGAQGGGFDAILAALSNFAGAQQKPVEMNLNLNTKNQVESYDIDAPIGSTVNINSGAMFGF